MLAFNFARAAQASSSVDFIRSANLFTTSTFEGRWSGSKPIRGCLPVSTKNGECCVDEWTWLLYANSPKGSSVSQSSCHSATKTRIYCSSSWLTRSVWPSDCGWYAVEAEILIPSRQYSLCMNSATNWGPQSDNIDLGSPCSFQTFWR